MTNRAMLVSILIALGLFGTYLVWEKVFKPAKTQAPAQKTIVQDSGMDGDGSMARTTGLVTAACALLFLEHGPLDGCGLEPGIHPPEGLSANAMEHIMSYMKDRGVQFISD